MSLFITKKEIEEALQMSSYRANSIFSSYKKKLDDSNLSLIDSRRLPKSWFVKTFAKEHGLTIEEVNIKFDLYEGKENP